MSPMKPNPLAGSAATKQQHPVMGHAQVWRAVSAMPQDAAAKAVDTASYTTPILGALAGNPDVTAKDVIKAAAQAAADGKIPPSAAVKFISSMPADADKIRPWLRGLYATNLSALVHLKAAAMPSVVPAVTASPAAPAPATPGSPA